jgi:Sporulation protein Cse60
MVEEDYYQVKLFEKDNLIQLEYEINDFLKSIGKANAKDIKFSTTVVERKQYYIAAVVYNPNSTIEKQTSI